MVTFCELMKPNLRKLKPHFWQAAKKSSRNKHVTNILMESLFLRGNIKKQTKKK